MIGRALKYKQFFYCESMELGRKVVSHTLCVIGNAGISWLETAIERGCTINCTRVSDKVKVLLIV